MDYPKYKSMEKSSGECCSTNSNCNSPVELKSEFAQVLKLLEMVADDNILYSNNIMWKTTKLSNWLSPEKEVKKEENISSNSIIEVLYLILSKLNNTNSTLIKTNDALNNII